MKKFIVLGAGPCGLATAFGLSKNNIDVVLVSIYISITNLYILFFYCVGSNLFNCSQINENDQFALFKSNAFPLSVINRIPTL